MVLVVEIEDRTSPKPFLGGWRDVARDLEYHDACSQTPVELLHGKRRRLVNRPVQTSAWVDRRSQAVCVGGGVERAVQVVPEAFPEVGERIVVARSEEELEMRRDAAVKIQRFYRYGKHRSYQSSVAEEDEAKEDGINDLDEDRSAFDDDSPDYRSTSRSLGEFHIVGPQDRGPGDLSLLRNLLDRWGCAEESKILETHPGDDRENSSARRAAQSDRLEREIEILRAIDTARSDVSRRRSERTRARFLDELSKPVDLGGPEKLNRSKVRVETLSVQRAREFREIYDRLLLDEDDAEEDEFERIELLFNLKKIASQHTCPASSSLENLIDQELFLLSSRAEPQRLEHLRSRIKLGFLRLARAALRHDYSVKCSSRTRLCPSCGRLKRLEAFEVDHRERLSRTCVDCAALRTRRTEATAHCAEIYERMLKELRRSEASRPDGASSLAFAMGPKSIGYLVNDIWHGRSAISECQDLEQLRLVRLEPSLAWSPWNTLLTTRREARMHEALAREDDAYDVELRRKFRRMNLQARLYFEALAKPSVSGLSL
ncbi:uncharacterized protein LOC100677955 isoform X1 [Nasonia vitripennis]|uniref:IQ motif and ubiquitin-like domain-containing protein n=1 Tax=Nasonia vitripennis TaxID=7425 RepID=A0A7M7IQJ2_NASVI|nr:uncharacterized protein LOC100677955 isoform X1 [Nasonia vitripennis]